MLSRAYTRVTSSSFDKPSSCVLGQFFVITFLGRQLRPSRPSRLFEIWRIVAFPRPGRQKRRKVCQGLDWLYSYSWVGTQSNWKLFLSQNNSGRNSPVHLPVQAWGAHGDHKVNSVKENILGHLCWASLDNCLPLIIMLLQGLDYGKVDGETKCLKCLWMTGKATGRRG